MITLRNTLTVSLTAALLLSACNKSGSGVEPAPAAPAGMAPASGLSGELAKLGLSSSQASGAIGSILSLAQSKLAPADFKQVVATIPSASSDMSTAKSLGATSSPITSASGLSAAFGKLGISPAIATQITPVVTEYVTKVGGPQVGALLAGIL